MRAAVLLTALALPAQAQWTLLDAHSTADFRGVDSVGKGIVWVSGTEGTVLRSEDAGYLWQHCDTPPGAEYLDFRGIQAFDANTAIVMSSGKGNLSRLYKTTDGCQTWKLIFTNPDKEGFWDAMKAEDNGPILLLGDPVAGHFQLRYSPDGGKTWRVERTVPSTKGEGAFAASNSSLLPNLEDTTCQVPQFFVTGGPEGAHIFVASYKGKSCKAIYHAAPLDFFPIGASAGIFSISAGHCLLLVGGDYLKPNERIGTAGYQCIPDDYKQANTLPGGYRSAVAYDFRANVAITVGPNGTDISTDDGRNWRALQPDPKAGDAPDADQHWNALSLPFVVGPHGRIGVLRPTALQPAKSP